MFRKTNKGAFLKAEGVSVRADRARANGMVPVNRAAKQAGVLVKDLDTWLGNRCEWHHHTTPSGRIKRVKYTYPLEPEQIVDVRAITAARRAREQAEKQTLLGNGYKPLMEVGDGAYTVWAGVNDYMMAPNGAELLADAVPVPDWAMAEVEAWRENVKRQGEAWKERCRRRRMEVR